jgi:hypothetical protein
MELANMKPLVLKNEPEYDDHINFKCRSEDKKAFYSVTGRKAAQYLRQAMLQITHQLSTEQEER